MYDLKITVDQLKNYLGTGLMVQVGSTKRNLTALQDDCRLAFVTAWMGSREKQMVGIENVKPICYRLSDLDKEIEHNVERFFPVDKIQELYDADLFDWDCKKMWVGESWTSNTIEWPYSLVQKLFEWHFWPFGDEYFEQGLVIDKIKIS